jgi:hypothetical protein
MVVVMIQRTDFPIVEGDLKNISIGSLDKDDLLAVMGPIGALPEVGQLLDVRRKMIQRGLRTYRKVGPISTLGRC